MTPGEERHERENGRERTQGSNSLNESAPPVHDDAIGPQGAALILELQRIQRAFDQEHRARAPRGPVTKSHERHRPAQSKKHHKKRKGMMSRAVDACLESIGFGGAPPSDRAPRARRDARPPALDRPARPDRSRNHRASPYARDTRPSLAKRPAPADPTGDHGVPHRLPAPPHAVPIANGPPSIALLESLAQDVNRQLARRSPEVAPGTEAELRGSAPAALKASVGRALAVALAHAKAGYGFLVKPGDDVLGDDAQGAELAARVGRSFERELRTGLRVLILGLGIAGGWATLVPLAGAVVVPGNLVVQSNVKKVQHPTGGVVAQIAVADGTHVNAGDLVARLDETQVRANLEVITKQLDEVNVRIARLVAERDGLDGPQMPPQLAGQADDADIKARFASETTLFNARATSRQSQKDLLKSRIAQLGEQIDGLEAQVKSNASQLELIAGELEGVQTLFEKRLAPITRLNSLQRESARLQGERGQLQSSIAETKSKIGEAQLQIIRVDQDFRADVIKDLRDAEAKQAELAERRVAAQDQLDRIDIRAPTSGVIHQLAVHTVGGVITAGQVVMEIVPDSDELLVEAHLQPNDVDQVRVGQATLVRFSAFNQRTTPQLSGVLSYVSADLTHDQQGNTSYYTVRVTLPDEQRRRLDGLQLISGMPAEVFVQTGSRTMMSYLLKPIREQLGRAFNER